MPTLVAATNWVSGSFFKRSRLHQPLEGNGHGHAGPGDGRGARAPVGLQHVAVQNDGAFAQGLHVDHRAQGAADEALDLMRSSAHLAPLASRGVRVSVARGSMPYSAVTHPRPLFFNQPGTPVSTVALHSTRVWPTSISTEPSAIEV